MVCEFKPHIRLCADSALVLSLSQNKFKKNFFKVALAEPGIQNASRKHQYDPNKLSCRGNAIKHLYSTSGELPLNMKYHNY